MTTYTKHVVFCDNCMTEFEPDPRLLPGIKSADQAAQLSTTQGWVVPPRSRMNFCPDCKEIAQQFTGSK